MNRYENSLIRDNLNADELERVVDLTHKMHKAGVFHCDLFNKNILYRYTERGTIQYAITDYGMALLYPRDTGVPPRIAAYDYASLLYGWYNNEHRRWLCSNIAEENIVAASAVRISNYCGAPNWLNALRVRISSYALLLNPKYWPGTTHPLQMYTDIVQTLPIGTLMFIGYDGAFQINWVSLDTVHPEEHRAVEETIDVMIKARLDADADN